MFCHGAKQTRHAISKRVNDHIISEYIKENREKKSAETIPQVAWKMFKKGFSYSDVLAEVQRLNATSSHPFPIAELEKLARKYGKL